MTVLSLTLPLLFVVFVWGWLSNKLSIIGLSLPVVHGQESHSWITLVGVYVAARVCRICEVDRFLSVRMCGIVAVILAAVGGFHYTILGGYNSIVTLAMATALFCMFKKIKIVNAFAAKIVEVITPSIFAVYLIHQSPLGVLLINKIGGLRADLPVPNILFALVFALVVFLLSLLLDVPRRLLCMRLLNRKNK